MGGLVSVRPTLGVARYHLLTGLRTGHAAFWITFLVAALHVTFAARLLEPASRILRADPIGLMDGGSKAISVILSFHLSFVLVATAVITAPRIRTGGVEPPDLLDTAPISAAGRFWGDMLGALACGLVIHLCTLPLLALAFLLAPVERSVFFWFEVVLVAMVILQAAGAAWRRRLFGAAGSIRSSAVAPLLLILVMGAFALTTRRSAFIDALIDWFWEPSPLRWSQLTREVMNPPLLFLLLFIIYMGFIAFFAIQSRRLIEQHQEVLR